jgi:hypothetical protein
MIEPRSSKDKWLRLRGGGGGVWIHQSVANETLPQAVLKLMEIS